MFSNFVQLLVILKFCLNICLFFILITSVIELNRNCFTCPEIMVFWCKWPHSEVMNSFKFYVQLRRTVEIHHSGIVALGGNKFHKHTNYIEIFSLPHWPQKWFSNVFHHTVRWWNIWTLDVHFKSSILLSRKVLALRFRCNSPHSSKFLNF